MKALYGAVLWRSLGVTTGLLLAGIALTIAGLALAHQGQCPPTASLARAAQQRPPAPEPQPQPPKRNNERPGYS